MRTSILAVAFASALLIVGAGGAFAATSPLQPQQSTTSTGSTTTGGGGTTAVGTSTSTSTGGASTATSAGTAASSGASITFDDQESSGETVLIQSATLPTNGFVVINGTSGGTERVLGSSYLLNTGLADNVRVQLNQPLNGTESLTAVLYADSNGNGAFDADADEPVYQGNSDRRIVDIADVTVQGSSSGTAAETSAGTSAETAGATETAASAGGAETTAAGGESAASTQSGGSENASGGNASGESTSSNGPGFGAVVAVVALLAVALLARRR